MNQTCRPEGTPPKHMAPSATPPHPSVWEDPGMYTKLPAPGTYAGKLWFCPHTESRFPEPCCHGNQES